MKGLSEEGFPVHGFCGIFILFVSDRSFVILGGKSANLYKSYQGQKV